MVFSSIPVYLDPPNWHQQQNLPLASDLQNPQLPPLPPLQPLTHGPGGSGGSGGGPGSIRPSSMADRARMAKMPQPETALKCPRCESANTKFCYFNNYSLSQPRHFCKTCRRYWTRGGALRNVPVGGGCRRNKKSKSSNSSSSSRSKSPVANTTTATTNQNADLMAHFLQPQSQLPTSFLASIQNLSRYGGGGNMGLNFSTHEMQQAQSDVHHDHHHMGFSGNMIDSLSAGGGGDHQGVDQWRNLQQIPFMGGFDQSITPSTGLLYAFNQTGSEQGGMVNGECSSSSQLQLRTNMPSTTSSRVSPVKMEDNGHGRSLTRPNLGISENNNTNQLIWGTGISAWTDLSGTLNSSSTTHLL